MRLVNPEYLLLLVPMLGIWALWALSTRHQLAFMQRVGLTAGAPTRKWVQRGLLAGASVLIVMAAAQPQVIFVSESTDVSERQVLYLLDISRSMLVQDVRPSRLEAAKALVRNINRQLLGEPQGTIVFADYAFMQCPITQDPGAFTTLLNVAHTQQFANHGTDLRNALLMASRAFEAMPAGAYARALVLVTDGEDFGENYTSAIARLKRQGVQVYAVGVGTASGGFVPALSDSAPTTQTAHISKLNSSTLKQLSEQFGTPPIEYNDSAADAQTIANQVLTLPPSQVMGANVLEKWVDVYQIPLILGLILWFTSSFFNLLPTLLERSYRKSTRTLR